MVKIVKNIHVSQFSGYIAGSGDGIVTVKGIPAKRGIWLLNAISMQVEKQESSLNNGHYIFGGLNPDAEYVVIARDYNREFEPFAWDYVRPANDLTPAEQQALWTSWQTN